MNADFKMIEIRQKGFQTKRNQKENMFFVWTKIEIKFEALSVLQQFIILFFPEECAAFTHICLSG